MNKTKHTYIFKEIGHQFIHLNTVDSTNNYAANLCKTASNAAGVVILSDYQTEGRGQRSNIWQSNLAENLTFSFIIDPKNYNINNPICINHHISVAILNFFEKMGHSTTVKWPNDIYFDDKKIAGILIENIYSGNNFKYSIIGIGLNVNQIEFDYPKATSLKKITGNNYNILESLKDLIFTMNQTFNYYSTLNSKEIMDIFNSKLYKKEIKSFFRIRDETVLGTIKGTTKNGSLIVEINNQEMLFNNGEISFV